MSAPALSLAAAYDDPIVPDDLIARLYRGGEAAVLEGMAAFSSYQRANLAVYCYRKSHLHRIGLAIAATCDQLSLVQTLGTAFGQTLFAQSRERNAAPERAPHWHRPKVTLARFTAGAAAEARAAVQDQGASSAVEAGPLAD